jgi:hypothetical protein
MVAVNTMSKGAETLLHLADYTSFTNQLFHLAGQLRQTFLPDMRFNKCSVLRGTLGAIAPVLRAGDESYLFFWRKNDPPSGFIIFMSSFMLICWRNLIPPNGHLCIFGKILALRRRLGSRLP